MAYILKQVIDILKSASVSLSAEDIARELILKGIFRPNKKGEAITPQQIRRAIRDDKQQQIKTIKTSPLSYRLNASIPITRKAKKIAIDDSTPLKEETLFRSWHEQNLRQNTISYWWVNHKQTFKKEFIGGYIWSPKVNKNGSRNQSYINLMLVMPGDIVYSYAGGSIKAVGIAEQRYEESPVPEEFGSVGDQWNPDGYLVKISWIPLTQKFRPKDHIELIRELLPSKYSPIQQTGDGNQSIYLAGISVQLGELLLSLLRSNNLHLDFAVDSVEKDLEEDNAERGIEHANIPETQKKQLIKARRGQGIFRSRLLEIEKGCRLTGVTNPAFLVASHIKPWAQSDNDERLDGNNGLLLSPHVDKLFDKGWIGFFDDGEIIIKATAIDVFKAWGLNSENVGAFSKRQKYYLAYHRERFKLK